MPEVHNGCGTWYYGKARIHAINGTCAHCGAATELRSYDTTKYIVVFMVPIVPLSKWRVLEQCKVCTRHRAIKLADWEEAKAADSAAVTAALRENPDDPENVVKAVAVATLYQDERLFRQVAEHLAGPMKGDAKVQAALGDGCSYFARGEEAIAAYTASLAVEDDPEVHERLAVQLLRRQRPEEAEEHLAHVLKGNDGDKVGYLLLLAEGYQARAEHEKAIALMDQAAAVSPELAADKQFHKQRNRAEKYRQRGRAIKPVTLAASPSEGYREGGPGTLARFIAPALVLLGLGIYFVIAWQQGRHREVFVVNGLNVPYTTVLAGRTLELPANGWLPVTVEEGTLHLSADARGVRVGEYDLDVRTTFWNRPFLSRTFVINPDRAALVTWEKTYYAKNPADAPAPEQMLHLGEALYEFSSIDYEFQAFPRSLEVANEDRVVAKTRLSLTPSSLLTDPNSLMLLLSLAPPDNPEIARDYFRTQLRFDPGQETFLWILKGLMDPEEFIAFLKERLEERPLRVNWHRAYQTTMESARPEHDLAGEYGALLEADPSNSDLAYLLGRVTEDPAEAERIFRQAAAGDPPSTFARYALAYQYVAVGRFEEALPLAEQAVAEQPGSLSFQQTLGELRLALEQYDRLLEESGTQAGSPAGVQFPGMIAEAQLLAIRGDVESARERIGNFHRAALAEGHDRKTAERMRQHLLATVSYASGDAPGYLKAQRAARDGQPDDFDTLFVAGELAKAAELAAAMENDTAAVTSHLAVYLKSSGQGDAALAAQELQAAIAVLRRGDREQRLCAAALDEGGRSDPDRLLRLSIRPQEKRVILAALGTRFPEDSDRYFALARKLNFQRVVPWLFLTGYLESSGE